MVVNRHDYFERLRNFDVRIGASKENLHNPTCHDRVRTVGQGQALRVQCDPPIPGRYVSVQMFGEGILAMCEVTVYSRIGALADLCQLENGDCEQVCYNLCNLKVKCGCWSGYTLTYDGKTCLDKDECQSNNGGCDIAKGICINTPGSYHCACKRGYELKENNEFICEDVNECGLNNAGCEHVCNNTAGSFNCDCRAGFKLKTDKRGCEDIDECALAAGKGGCEHKCSNFEGGYFCSCNAGYRLMDNDKGCEEIYCPALEAPFRGRIAPTICTDDRSNIRRSTVCTYDCVVGHNLAGGDLSVICQINGFWQGKVPYCKPVVCPKLSALDKGGVVPASCSKSDVEYGVRCVFYCDDGYELSGPRYTTCQSDSSWSDIAPLSCVKVNKDPWIACPIDRVEELDSDKSTVVLGYKWQLPRTNMKNVTVSPSNYDENYPFPAGKHRVMWTGISDSGSLKSCSFHITVNDVTPPSTQNCPTSFSDKANNLQLQKAVTWSPPKFTDNVIVTSVISNRQPGFIMNTYTSITIRYTAVDAAGNVGYCMFNITLEGLTCPTVAHPKNGRTLKFGFFLQLRCNPGLFFNPSPPGYPGEFKNPSYLCQNNKWVSLSSLKSVITKAPDCFRYVIRGTTPCEGGSVPLVDKYCLNCYPGSYSNNKTQTCELCNPGFYQDEEGKEECLPCPKNTSSVIKGSKSMSDCKAICKPGYYSTNGGVEPCEKCPMGTYQENEQQTQCHPCPAGTNTTGTGSTSQDACLSPVRITQTIPPTDYTVYKNETFPLACYIEGSPTPSVSWKKVGGFFPSSDRLIINKVYDIDMRLSGIEYIIANAVLSDAGTYECHASNVYGAVTKQVRISVMAVVPSG
ncbi:signal peptide, CUB and EGF-like domain-containing protein 1 [Montipora foliosa]|uniref:signal peptide, CUB and EGF-like domain-containing protein 1 n=1 Tax=Montipora foliosa TaxID=591990 RepID=UPI0035F1FF7C